MAVSTVERTKVLSWQISEITKLLNEIGNLKYTVKFNEDEKRVVRFQVLSKIICVIFPITNQYSEVIRMFKGSKVTNFNLLANQIVGLKEDIDELLEGSELDQEFGNLLHKFKILSRLWSNPIEA